MIQPEQPRIDSRGHRRTASLFKEMTQDTQLKPFLTMKDHNHSDMISAYQVYMSSVDEYDAAMQLVGSMFHWRKLCQCQWFMEGNAENGFAGLQDWRNDMSERDASRAKRLAAEHLSNGNLKAASLLLDIAAGKKTKQPTKKKSSPQSTRRGTQQSAAVVDINSIMSGIDSE